MTFLYLKLYSMAMQMLNNGKKNTHNLNNTNKIVAMK